MLKDCTPGKLHGHVAVNMNHYILVFGGKFIKDYNHIPLHEIWMYNLYTEEWRKHVIPQGQPVPTETERGYACAVVIGSNVYMFGGHTLFTTTNTLWKLAADPQESFAWSEIVMTNKEKTPIHGIVTLDGNMQRNYAHLVDVGVHQLDFCINMEILS